MASVPSTRSCARWRSAVASGAATSSRASAAPSSRWPVPSIGCAAWPRDPGGRSAGRRRRGPRCWPRPTRPTLRRGAGLAARRRRATSRTPGRVAGAYVVLHDGDLALYLERGGRSLLTFAPFDDDDVAAAAIAALGTLHPGRPPAPPPGRARRRRPGRDVPAAASPRGPWLPAGYRGLVLVAMSAIASAGVAPAGRCLKATLSAGPPTCSGGCPRLGPGARARGLSGPRRQPGGVEGRR